MVNGELKPVPQTLYPRKDTLNEAMEYLTAQVPILTPNELHTALMTYHNTLLHVQSQETQS